MRKSATTGRAHKAPRRRWQDLLAEAPRRSTISTWALLPLRLFLGITFVYAGLQKLTDSQYFKPSATGYIGKQIASFAHGSPIGGFLLHVAMPHAMLFGALVAYGELAIGLGILAGVLFRPAACFGALLSLTFFLSASWRVYPYFYGADIVFLFGWVTLVLTGPTGGGWPAFDALLAQRILARVPPRSQEFIARALAIILGADGAISTASVGEAGGHQDGYAAATSIPARATTARPARQMSTGRSAHPARGYGRRATPTTRRDFLRGSLAGAASILGIVFIVSLFRSGENTASPPSGTPGGATTSTDLTPGTTGTTGTTNTGGNTIAQVSAVPANSAAQFTIPSSGDPGVLVHLNSGQFVAFDATCTHAGCPVQYDPSSQLLICPCHGAEFDPAHQATVVQGPTDTPLTSVPVHVDHASGAITLG